MTASMLIRANRRTKENGIRRLDKRRLVKKMGK